MKLLRVIVDYYQGRISPDVDTPCGVPDQDNIDTFYSFMTEHSVDISEMDRLSDVCKSKGYLLLVTHCRL